MQEIDGTRLEGVWRPGTLAIMPPGGSGYAASGAVGMIGLAIVPALCSWTSTPPFALIKASDRSMRNEQQSAPHSNLGPRTGTSKLWWRAACPLSGVDRVKADARSGDRVGCSNARRWWKAARPLSSVHREKPDIHSGGRAKSRTPTGWWKTACPLSGGRSEKRTLVQSIGQWVRDARAGWRAAGPLSGA